MLPEVLQQCSNNNMNNQNNHHNNNHNNHHNNLHNNNNNDGATMRGATDFSIAAIMGRQSMIEDDTPDKSPSVISDNSESYEDDDPIIEVDDCKTPIKTSGRIGRPTKSSLSSSTASDDERLTPESQTRPIIVGSCNADELKPILCHLETKDLWEKFHELGTEMIITKTGRRMFPTVRVSFSNVIRPIKSTECFAVLLDIIPVDSRRYRYAYHRSAWLVAGKADPPPPPRLHAHPDTPFSYETLLKQVISFEKAKLTNNELDRNGQVVLNSMHRYQPRIHLVLLKSGQKIPTTPNELQTLKHKTFVFPATVFTAVTAYQNQLITKLKIDSNPFAKGFRDSSDFGRDPIDALFLEQHMNGQFRHFGSPADITLSHLVAHEAFERAKHNLMISSNHHQQQQQQHQQSGQSSSPSNGQYATPDANFLSHMYQRQQFINLNIGFWNNAILQPPYHGNFFPPVNASNLNGAGGGILSKNFNIPSTPTTTTQSMQHPQQQSHQQQHSPQQPHSILPMSQSPLPSLSSQQSIQLSSSPPALLSSSSSSSSSASSSPALTPSPSTLQQQQPNSHHNNPSNHNNHNNLNNHNIHNHNHHNPNPNQQNHHVLQQQQQQNHAIFPRHPEQIINNNNNNNNSTLPIDLCEKNIKRFHPYLVPQYHPGSSSSASTSTSPIPIPPPPPPITVAAATAAAAATAVTAQSSVVCRSPSI